MRKHLGRRKTGGLFSEGSFAEKLNCPQYQIAAKTTTKPVRRFCSLSRQVVLWLTEQLGSESFKHLFTSCFSSTLLDLSSLSDMQLISFPFELSLYKLLEKELATHSSTLAWKIPWTEEPGGLQSMGSLRVRHD